MAAKKDDGKTEINYVAALNFMKKNYNNASFSQRVKWPDEWGYIVPIYKEMYDTLAQGNETQLPEKELRVSRDTFASLEVKPECKRPPLPPPPDSKMYGWKPETSVVEKADKWIAPWPYMSMYKELGWGHDSQH